MKLQRSEMGKTEMTNLNGLLTQAQFTYRDSFKDITDGEWVNVICVLRHSSTLP